MDEYIRKRCKEDKDYHLEKRWRFRITCPKAPPARIDLGKMQPAGALAGDVMPITDPRVFGVKAVAKSAGDLLPVADYSRATKEEIEEARRRRVLREHLRNANIIAAYTFPYIAYANVELTGPEAASTLALAGEFMYAGILAFGSVYDAKVDAAVEARAKELEAIDDDAKPIGNINTGEQKVRDPVHAEALYGGERTK